MKLKNKKEAVVCPICPHNGVARIESCYLPIRCVLHEWDSFKYTFETSLMQHRKNDRFRHDLNYDLQSRRHARWVLDHN